MPEENQTPKLSLAGSAIEYKYTSGDTYRVDVIDQTIRWTALSGSAEGSSGVEDADCVEVAPNVHMVTWLEASQEGVTLIVNVTDNTVFCSYMYDGRRHFWHGSLLSLKPKRAQQ